MESFAYTFCARVHVALHGTTDPTDEEWRTYLEHIGARLAEVDSIVAMTMGGGPNREQRAQAVEFWKKQANQPRRHHAVDARRPHGRCAPLVHADTNQGVLGRGHARRVRLPALAGQTAKGGERNPRAPEGTPGPRRVKL